MTTIRVGGFDIIPELAGNCSPFRCRVTSHQAGADVALLTLELVGDHPAALPDLTVRWDVPVVDVATLWTTAARRDKGIWMADDLEVDPLAIRPTYEAPVAAMIGGDDHNRLTFALSATLDTLQLTIGVLEEPMTIRCGVRIDGSGSEPRDRLKLVVRIDGRHLPYERILDDVASWWVTTSVDEPAAVPDVARQPVYSTWYSFHQKLVPDRLVHQCRLAKDLGCEAVIVDDGWQTLDSQRGYAYTGDWEPLGVPDISELVERIHDLGMRFLLWYSVPDVGLKSNAYERFAGQILYVNERRGAAVLDPRYPDVRHYLIQTFARAVDEWNVDGLKLDFVDRFGMGMVPPAVVGDGRDYATIGPAVDRLLRDVRSTLVELRPEVMIEFRQPYVGPVMRRYANMFRALDCPTDHHLNRVATVDLRLLSSTTPVHSDMLVWRSDEPVERAALQLLAVLFSVPQISVRLDELPREHVEMVRFWLSFFREHRSVLLSGQLRAISPGLNYPVVIAENEAERVVAVYEDIVVPGSRTDSHVVNAKASAGFVLEMLEPFDAHLIVRDVCGRVVRDERSHLDAGPHRIDVPPAGLTSVTPLERS